MFQYFIRIRFLFILIFLSFGLLINAQKVFNIKADFILEDGNTLGFIYNNDIVYDMFNFDMSEMFNSNMYEILYGFIKKNDSNSVNRFIPVSNLKNESIKNLLKHIKNIEYYTKIYSKGTNKKENIKLYLLNNHFFICEYYNEKSKLLKTELYPFFIVNINNKKPILLYFDDWGDLIGYLFKLKNKKIKSVFKKYELTHIYNKRNNDFIIEDDISDYYKIINNRNKYMLTDAYFFKNMLKTFYDSVILFENLIITKKKEKYTIYNLSLETIEKKIQAFHISLNSIQIIQNKQIFWIDKFGNKSKKPKVLEMFVCGNEPSYEKHILKINNKFYYIEKYYDNREELNLCDTSQFILPKKITEIKFYNNGFTDYYYNEDSNINKILFILKNKNNKYSLAEVEKQKNKIIIKTILLKDADTIEYIKQNIRFYKNGLYGYYPQNKKAKYKYLGDFNYYFARFELPDGKKGWTDKKGNEYFDK